MIRTSALSPLPWGEEGDGGYFLYWYDRDDRRIFIGVEIGNLVIFWYDRDDRRIF